MDLNYPNAERIDSTCDKKLPAEEVPNSVSPRCNEEAVTWVNLPNGTRRYVCEEHALELLRFPKDSEERLRDLDYHTELVPLAAERGVNLGEGKDRETLINRMAQRKVPGDLPENPRAKVCSECRKLTLLDELHPGESRCLGCRGEREELDPTAYPGVESDGG